MLSIAASRRSIRYSGERSCRDIAKQGPIPTVITRDARFLEESLAGGLARRAGTRIGQWTEAVAGQSGNSSRDYPQASPEPSAELPY
jgi:hypothetical protein